MNSEGEGTEIEDRRGKKKKKKNQAKRRVYLSYLSQSAFRRMIVLFSLKIVNRGKMVAKYFSIKGLYLSKS
jgi:hypothetical protein